MVAEAFHAHTKNPMKQILRGKSTLEEEGPFKVQRNIYTPCIWRPQSRGHCILIAASFKRRVTFKAPM